MHDKKSIEDPTQQTRELAEIADLIIRFDRARVLLPFRIVLAGKDLRVDAAADIGAQAVAQDDGT